MDTGSAFKLPKVKIKTIGYTEVLKMHLRPVCMPNALEARAVCTEQVTLTVINWAMNPQSLKLWKFLCDDTNHLGSRIYEANLWCTCVLRHIEKQHWLTGKVKPSEATADTIFHISSMTMPGDDPAFWKIEANWISFNDTKNRTAFIYTLMSIFFKLCHVKSQSVQGGNFPCCQFQIVISIANISQPFHPTVQGIVSPLSLRQTQNLLTRHQKGKQFCSQRGSIKVCITVDKRKSQVSRSD